MRRSARSPGVRWPTVRATHAFATAEEAHEAVREITWGQMADGALIFVGTPDEKVVRDAFN